MQSSVLRASDDRNITVTSACAEQEHLLRLKQPPAANEVLLPHRSQSALFIASLSSSVKTMSLTHVYACLSRKLSAFALMASLASPSVASYVVYSQGPQNSGPSYASCFSLPLGCTQQVADDFTLTEDTLITDIHWWGNYDTGTAPATDDFTITFYEDIFSRPGKQLDALSITRQSASGLTNINGVPVFKYDALLSAPFEVLANTTYWVSIDNDPDGTAWYWLQSTQGNGQNALQRDGWFPGDSDVAFELTTVPEPTTLAVVAVGLAGITVLRRKKRAQYHSRFNANEELGHTAGF